MYKHQKRINNAHKELNQIKKNVRQHEWSLQYHIMPEANWMNDPNGFCRFKGEYHLFYQHHPYSPHWGPMHWGHVKSKDLVHWEHLPIALAPSESYDINGCFSGSAIVNNEKLYLMYTGNKWTGSNQDTDLKQVQCLAVSEDGIHFEKLDENPVISTAPVGDIHPYHFRDPKIWKEEDSYYCVIGSQTHNRIGQVLLYRSPDLVTWKFINVIAKGNGNMGYMWECPDLFSLDGHNVLVISPQGVKPEGDLYHNLHQAVYVIGDLNIDIGEYTFENFQLLDYGFDFYAPQTTLDDKGRRVLVAWMAMWESEMPEQNHNWAGAMTIPRIISIQNGQLQSIPAPELELLRYDPVSYQNIQVEKSRFLDGIHGNCLELKLVIDAKNASEFGLKVRLNASGSEQTVLTYNVEQEVLKLDRNHSGKGPGGVRRAPIALKNGQFQLQLFLDNSSLEVFMQNGEKVMTARIYPNSVSSSIQFFSDQRIEILQLNKWSLRRSM